MPTGIATLKKTRVFNAADYRNGGRIPISYEDKNYESGELQKQMSNPATSQTNLASSSGMRDQMEMKHDAAALHARRKS